MRRSPMLVTTAGQLLVTFLTAATLVGATCCVILSTMYLAGPESRDLTEPETRIPVGAVAAAFVATAVFALLRRRVVRASWRGRRHHLPPRVPANGSTTGQVLDQLRAEDR